MVSTVINESSRNALHSALRYDCSAKTQTGKFESEAIRSIRTYNVASRATIAQSNSVFVSVLQISTVHTDALMA